MTTPDYGKQLRELQEAVEANLPPELARLATYERAMIIEARMQTGLLIEALHYLQQKTTK
jgi:hypothetical protein